MLYFPIKWLKNEWGKFAFCTGKLSYCIQSGISNTPLWGDDMRQFKAQAELIFINRFLILGMLFRKICSLKFLGLGEKQNKKYLK